MIMKAFLNVIVGDLSFRCLIWISTIDMIIIVTYVGFCIIIRSVDTYNWTGYQR